MNNYKSKYYYTFIIFDNKSIPIPDQTIINISKTLKPTITITAIDVPGIETFNLSSSTKYISEKIILSTTEKPFIQGSTKFVLVEDFDNCGCGDLFYIGFGSLFSQRFSEIKYNFTQINRSWYIIPYHSLEYVPYSIVYIKKDDPDFIIITHSLEWSNSFI